MINDVVELGGTISKDTIINTQTHSFGLISQFTPTKYSGLAVQEYTSQLGYYDNGATFSRILAQQTAISMSTSDGTNSFQLVLNQNAPAFFNDTFYNKGLEYAGSYSANFTTYSLVDKFYVDSQISSATYGLSSVLSADNYADTFSIRMGNGTIQSLNNLSSIKVSDSTITLTTDKLEHDGNLENASNHIYSMRSNQTSNATPLNIFTFSNNDFGSTNAAISFDIIVNGYCETSSEGYFSKLFAGFICIGSTISQVGTTSQTQLSNFTSSVTSAINTNGSIISIEITGETGKTINWCSRFNYQWAT